MYVCAAFIHQISLQSEEYYISTTEIAPELPVGGRGHVFLMSRDLRHYGHSRQSTAHLFNLCCSRISLCSVMTDCVRSHGRVHYM